jgi:hypothetical protein
MSTYFENDRWRAAWFPVNPDSGRAVTGQVQPITAVWRNPDHLDLFMTGSDGRVMGTFFENDAWQPEWYPLAPESGRAAPGQPITAVWRSGNNHLDLFMTGHDGRVMTRFFENDQWRSGWFPLAPASAQVMPGQPITAVWSNPNHLDLFVAALDGRVMSISFNGSRWLAGWFAI